MQNRKVVAHAWVDNKVVTVMSTNSQPSATGTVPRRKKDGSRVPVPCPESVILYNKWIGAVDHDDQLGSYYSCHTKSQKFYKYIYYLLLDVTITNSFILYKNFHPNPRYRTIKEFHLQLARELIGDYRSRVVRLPHYSCNTFQPQSQASQVHGILRGGIVFAVLSITYRFPMVLRGVWRVAVSQWQHRKKIVEVSTL